MHSHPDMLAVFLADNRSAIHPPRQEDGGVLCIAGQTMVIPAEVHVPENLSDEKLELILIELK